MQIQLLCLQSAIGPSCLSLYFLIKCFKVRIRSEHAIGVLKGRFQSLKELRFQISDQKKHTFIILWIVCCLILHNLIIRIEEADGGFEADIEEWYRERIEDGGNSDDESDEEDGWNDSRGAENGVGHERTPPPPGILFHLDKMQILLNSFD